MRVEVEKVEGWGLELWPLADASEAATAEDWVVLVRVGIEVAIGVVLAGGAVTPPDDGAVLAVTVADVALVTGFATGTPRTAGVPGRCLP